MKQIFFIQNSNADNIDEERGKESIIRLILFSLISILLTRVIFYLIYVMKFNDMSFSGFLSNINIWDAEWYRSIVTDGYPKTAESTSSWAFFPLYPLMVRTIVFLTGLSIDLAGFILSNICCFVSCLFSYKYIILTRKNREEAYFYLTMMVFGVCGFYETLLYTEAMYIMLLSMTFYFMKRRNYLIMGICGALLSATRNTGVFFVFVILLDQIHIFRNDESNCSDVAGKGKHFNVIKFFSKLIPDYKLVLGTMMVPAGLFIHMLYLYYLTGDAFAFVHIQKAFMKDTKGGIINVWVRAFELYHDQLWFWCYMALLIAVIVMVLMNGRGDETIWGVLNWIIPQQRGLGAMHRYFHMNFVFELMFSDWCMRFRRYIRYLILIVAFFAECIMMSMWLDGNGWLV